MSAADPELAAPRLLIGLRPVEVVGIGLFVALVGWALLVGQVTGRDPLPMAVLVAATGATAFVAREVTRRSNTMAPLAVLLASLGAILVTWPAAIHPHFGLTGYSNANGALYVIGVGAAGLVVLRAVSLRVRLAAGAAGLALAGLPWVFGADAAAGNALVVVAATVLLLATRRGPPRLVLPLSVLVAVAVVIGTIVAGVAYRGDGEGDGAWRLTERRLVLWSEAADLLVTEPVTGVGPGGFAALSPTALQDRDARWAHHAPLQVGAETGLPGMLLLLGLLGWAFVWLHQGSGRRGGALAAVVLALSIAHASIDFVWHYPAVPIALAAVVGAGASAGRPAGR